MPFAVGVDVLRGQKPTHPLFERSHLALIGDEENERVATRARSRSTLVEDLEHGSLRLCAVRHAKGTLGRHHDKLVACAVGDVARTLRPNVRREWRCREQLTQFSAEPFTHLLIVYPILRVEEDAIKVRRRRKAKALALGVDEVESLLHLQHDAGDGPKVDFGPS